MEPCDAGAGSRPITILHLSDLHMAPWQRAKQDFIRSLAVYEPDLIIDTGDNLGHENGLEGVQRALEPFAGAAGLRARVERLLRPDAQEPRSLSRAAPALRRSGPTSTPLRSTPTWATTSAGSISTTPCAADRAEGHAPRVPRNRRRPPRLGSSRRAPRGRSSRCARTWSGRPIEPPTGAHHRRHPRALPAVLDALVSQHADLIFARATPTAARCASRGARPSSPTATSRTRRRRVCSVVAHRGAQRLPRGVGRTRHVDLRARALRVPAGGDRADADAGHGPTSAPADQPRQSATVRRAGRRGGEPAHRHAVDGEAHRDRSSHGNSVPPIDMLCLWPLPHATTDVARLGAA